MDLEQIKNQMNREMETFTRTLNELLAKYSDLLKRNDLTSKELSELGEIEYFLIDLNAKIAKIKRTLSHDLFGLAIDVYYKTKEKARLGDKKAEQKLTVMRASFGEVLKNEMFTMWN